MGGTFTDFVLISESGETRIHKTLSTPEDPSEGVLQGIGELAGMLGVGLAQLAGQIVTFVHGTTVATNALLTLRGAKTALITTRGFRDALEMRRGIREEQYNNHCRNVVPLIPRYLRLTVDERIDSQGRVLTPLRQQDLDPLIEFIRKEEVGAVAICFLNAYKNSIHEELTSSYLREHYPSGFITASVEVLPSIRFYERISTTAVNAFIGPIVVQYIDNLTKKLDAIGFKGSLLLMQSNGGVVTPEYVKLSPASMVLSGPAAAPTAGGFYANLMGYRDCITIDMGGTSFDASLIVNGESVTSSEGSINRRRIALPSLDIATIGAGGGSIGWIDAGGLLQMGPQSAGAKPGPICYDRGGILPTCTDADLTLGYLDPDYFAGGKLRLNLDKSRQIIEKELAPKLGLTAEQTAIGMYRVINTNMAQGVRMVSVERGYDPRESLLLVAGGAGAIHAGEICKVLEIPLFVVPAVASTLCAAGMLLGDLKHDYVRSFITPFSNIELAAFLNTYDKLRSTGADTLSYEGIDGDNMSFLPSLDLRYIGQYHEVQLWVSWEEVKEFKLDAIRAAFHKEHNRLFGYSLEEEGAEIEIINLRLRAVGRIEKPDFLSKSEAPVPLEQALKGRRRAYIPEANEFREIPVYNGDVSLCGHTIPGPAVIEKVDTSIFLGESYDCLVDSYRSFIVYDRKIYPSGPPATPAIRGKA